ncbi:MAG: CHASE2 domain-containing protein [Spirochaetales bacterium]|nr:CHASE2 domain-containing protein [Spirochaetales bacterium]
MKNKKIITLIIIISVFSLLGLFFQLFSFEYKSWSLIIYDMLFKIRYSLKGRAPLSPYIYSVSLIDSDMAILNKNAKDISIYSELLNTFNINTVKSIGIDHIFLENPAIDSLIKVTRELKNLYYPVIPFQRNHNYPQTPGVNLDIPEDFLSWNPVLENKGNPIEGVQILASHPELQKAARGLGHILRDTDSDGRDRKIPLIIRYKNTYIPGFAFRMICDYLCVPPRNISISFGNYILLKNAVFPFSGLKKDIKIPIDDKGRMRINFSGPYKNSFNNYSFHTIIKNTHTLRSQLKIDEHSLIFVSSYTFRDNDYYPGIFDTNYPLIYVQLETANTILNESFLTEFPIWVKLFLLVFFAGFLWILHVKVRNIIFFSLSLIIGIVYIVICISLFLYCNLLPCGIFPFTGFFVSAIVLLVYSNMHRIKRLKLQEQQHREKLIQADKMVTIGTMVSGLAHDINNPNSVIKTEADFLSKNFVYIKEIMDAAETGQRSMLFDEISYPQLNENFSYSLTGIRKACNKIEGIINTLKDYYKQTSPENTEQVDIITVIQESFFFLPRDMKNTVILNFNSPREKLPLIRGNTQRLIQVFYNILQNSCNAIKTMDSQKSYTKGTITITITTDNNKNMIRICIKDTGCGIDPSILHRITEPLFTTRMKQGGTGLGLYIVDTIIKEHKGKMEIQSELNKWTKVIISLPVIRKPGNN